ncbi:MAG: TIGR03546 family protein [Bdellovibrionales bacterium]
MLFIIQQIITLLKLLHAESSDKKIALATVLGFFSAVSPALSLQGVLLILIALFFRVQFGAFLFSWLIFSILSLPLAGAFSSVGEAVLYQEGLREAFIWAQKSALLSSTRFYNTVVLGGLIVAILLAVPLYFLVKKGLQKYREVVVDRIMKTKFYYVLKSSFLFKIVGFYEKYKSL